VRIALVSRQLGADRHSGIVRGTVDMARGLADAGHEVHAIAEAGTGELDLPDAVRVHRAPGGPALARAAAVHATLAHLHARGELDVALVPLWGGEGLLATRDPRFPTVVTCMTTARTLAEIDPEWGARADALKALRLERACMQAARHVHGLTEPSLCKALADYGAAPLTRGVVPRGLRDRAAAPAPGPRDGAATPAAVRAGAPVEVLFVGRREPRKGVDVLLAAVSALLGDGLDIALTVVGRQMRAREPRPAAGDSRIRFLGPVSEARLSELYAAADVVCQPARYESQGIVLVEAMMFGKPIVTTSAGGIPAVVEDGGNALLAEPGDAASLARSLRSVVESAPLRRRMAARSRELFLERFEIGSVTGAMVCLLEEAVAAHAETAPERSEAILVTALEERAVAAERELAVLTRSRSWRLTEPLRVAGRAARATRQRWLRTTPRPGSPA
jgi:glycosyltransferase involved in cell wall biosynthesis